MVAHEGTRLGARLAQAKRWKNKELEREAAIDLVSYHIRAALEKVYEHLANAGFHADLVDQTCDEIEELAEQLLTALPRANSKFNKVMATKRLAEK